MEKTISGVFKTVGVASLCLIIAFLLFGDFWNTSNSSIDTTIDHDGSNTQGNVFSNWEGVVWQVAKAFDVDFASYYYKYSFTTAVTRDNGMQESLGYYKLKTVTLNDMNNSLNGSNTNFYLLGYSRKPSGLYRLINGSKRYSRMYKDYYFIPINKNTVNVKYSYVNENLYKNE